MNSNDNLDNLDIITLIEKNPLTRLSKTYNNKFIQKIQKKFNENQQKLFVASFYTYLQYNSKTDFVIDMSNVWKWIGFSRKDHCKTLLEKHFIKDIDFKIIKIGEENNAPATSGAGSSNKNLGGAGLNKETILMNVNTFKKLCLKSNTKKADEIHDYFIKLEETLQEIVNEESNELKLQLQQKEKELIHEKELSEKQLQQKEKELIHEKELSEKQLQQKEKELIHEKEELLEKTLLEQFPINTQCIYYGKIDNKDTKNSSMIKFGNSNNLTERVKIHKKTYTNFKLTAVFKVKNKIHIENCIKKHPILKKRIRSTIINNLNYTELLAIDNQDFTLEKINEYINEIIQQNEYNIENYDRLVLKNEELESYIRKLEEEKCIFIKSNEKLTTELEKYKPKEPLDAYKIKKLNRTETKNGYAIYVFKCSEFRYNIGLCKSITLETIEKSYKSVYPDGRNVYTSKIKHSFLEKLLIHLLKENLLYLGDQAFEGDIVLITSIIDLVTKLEELLIDKNGIENIKNILENKNTIIQKEEIDPETPQIKKAKRSIDQINPDTGAIINTFESIEAAGRSLGLTTGTAVGIALREKRKCKGFLFRYSGISKEDQYSEQKVIKINCSTAEKFYFPTIADAARDAKISAPALRQRVITKVHLNNFHWIFDKTNSHYV